MKPSDVLIEFEKQDKTPPEFKLLMLSVSLIVCFYFYILYNDIKEIYVEEHSFWNWSTYRYFMILIYPIVGLQGYMLSKKYGWFILSHYLLLSTIIMLFSSLYSLINAPINLKKLLVVLAIIFLNAGSLYIIFKKSLLQIFQIRKEDKILFILLNIVFAIINAVVWAVSH